MKEEAGGVKRNLGNVNSSEEERENFKLKIVENNDSDLLFFTIVVLPLFFQY